MTKPIFIIEFPKYTHLEIIEKSQFRLEMDNKELIEQYHVLLTVGRSDELKYFCFNSQYKEEEFKELQDLIELLKKENTI